MRSVEMTAVVSEYRISHPSQSTRRMGHPVDSLPG